jgi:hypothetical protein
VVMGVEEIGVRTISSGSSNGVCMMGVLFWTAIRCRETEAALNNDPNHWDR